MAVATSLSIAICLSRLSGLYWPQEMKLHSDWINKFLVTVHNSAYLEVL